MSVFLFVRPSVRLSCYKSSFEPFIVIPISIFGKLLLYFIVIKMDRKSAGDDGLTFPDFSNSKINRWDARHDVIALPSSVFDQSKEKHFRLFSLLLVFGFCFLLPTLSFSVIVKTVCIKVFVDLGVIICIA